MFSEPEWAAEAFVTGWFASMVSPMKGFLSTAGELGQQDFKPSQYEDRLTAQLFNQLGGPITGTPSEVMKKRDFLGRVVDAPDRVGFLLGKKEHADLINAELEFLHIKKRTPAPDKISSFPGMTLSKFTLKEDLTAEEKQTLENAIPARDGVNAYEDYLIMAGSTNLGANNSQVSELQKYFKSSGYKNLKSQIENIDENASIVEVKGAELALKEIKKVVSRLSTAGNRAASAKLWNVGHLYVNSVGETLKERYMKNQETLQQAGEMVTEEVSALERLGGNK
jgi:uncharacterized protein (DUF2267 family)